MSPLYAGTIEEGSIINVITQEQAQSRTAQTQLTNIKRFSFKTNENPKQAGQARQPVSNLKRSQPRRSRD